MPLDTAAYSTAHYESMSPTLLAKEPATDGPQSGTPGKDWVTIYAALEGRLAGLRMWRYTWWQYWAELARYILPRRYRWLVVSNTMNKGLPLNDAIVDSTTTMAMQVCGSGMWSGLTSPSRPWFKLALGLPWVDLDADGAEWLEDTENRIYAVLAGSNFYDIMAQAFQDVATFGTAPIICYEDEDDIVRFYLPCSGEYYLASGARLSVDTLYREFVLTVQQIVEMFGLDNCPPQVRNLWMQGGGSLENEFVVAHAIEPNTEIAPRGARGENIRVVPAIFTYREVYWLKGITTAAELSRRGFREKPFATIRWAVTANDPYGRSPGMDCLGDTKQLQLETRRKAEFIEKLVRPPMTAHASMKNEPSSILPGHITYVNSEDARKGFMPAFEVQPQALGPMVADIKEVQARIERCFFVDVFMAITRMEGVQPRNELEITKRDLERLQVLGPFVNLFEGEARIILERVATIMDRRGALLPKPKSLVGVPIKFDFRSMMKIAQEAAETANLSATFAMAGNLSAASKAAGVPDPIRTMNLDKGLRLFGDKVQVPESIWYTEDQVAEHDAVRAKAAQGQAAMEATAPMVDAAHTLSQTPVGGGQSALTAMLGGQ